MLSTFSEDAVCVFSRRLSESTDGIHVYYWHKFKQVLFPMAKFQWSDMFTSYFLQSESDLLIIIYPLILYMPKDLT